MRHRRIIFAALISSFTFSAAAATTAYVSDRLPIAVHGANDPDAPVVKQVVSGSPLTILETAGALAKVRTEDGSVGWVDPKLLIDEKPAQVMYIEVSDRLKKAQETIKTLQDTSNAPRDESKTLADLRAQLKAAQDKAAEAERNMRDTTTSLNDANTRISSLQAEIADLRSTQDRGAVEVPKVANEEPRGEFYPAGTAPSTVGKGVVSLTIFVACLVLVLILGAGSGAYAVDYYVRKRHGGFRIY